MNKPIDYETMARMYRECAEKGEIPNLLSVPILFKTKAMRRRIGRLVRQGIVKRGDVIPMWGRYRIGAIVV